MSLSDDATAEGSDLLWTVPYTLSPLVHGQFNDRGWRVGVNGQPLSESDIKDGGYRIRLHGGQVEVRIAAGGQRGHVKVNE